MDEFGFIAKYLSGLAGREALDLKDDAAVWTPPKGYDAVISMDTLVEGVHFPDEKFDRQIAHKLVAVNVSDLTAKGADPIGYFMSLTLRKDISENELRDFCDGLAAAQSLYGLKLWGGDTTRGGDKNVLSITIIGTVPNGQTVTRAGAQIGDVLCVTGTIVDSYLGLQRVLGSDAGSQVDASCVHVYHEPNPPFALRHTIRAYAHGAVDVSDGLLADAGHLAQASGVAIDISLAEIPLSAAATTWRDGLDNQQDALIKLATGGDDYQTLMAVPPANLELLQAQAKKTQTQLKVIGLVKKGAGVRCLDTQGREVQVYKQGYTHF